MKRIRNIIMVLLLIFGVGMFAPVSGIGGISGMVNAQAATKIALSKTSASLAVGGKASIQLKGTSSKKKVTWTSSNTKVATVKKSGANGYKVTITAKKSGSATVTAKYNGKKYTVKVTVKAPALSKKTLSLTAGKTGTIKLNNTVSSKTLTWKSSKTSVATVKKGSNGSVTITAKKAGTANITASYNGKKYVCKVTVKKKTTTSVKITTIAKLKAAYPNTSKNLANVEKYIMGMTTSETNTVRNNIYKEIGASTSLKPQYNCWLIANYVCKNLKYTSMNAASWVSCDYQTGYYLENAKELAANSIYSLYLGEGVCINYAQVTKWLLNGLNITNYMAQSDDHAWNQVKIDGKWYNIDTTWGDPFNYWQTNGIVYYMSPSQFLVNDTFHDKTGKLDNIHAKKCTNTRFISYLYTKTQPNASVYSFFTIGGVTYYTIYANEDYWLTNKWKTL